MTIANRKNLEFAQIEEHPALPNPRMVRDVTELVESVKTGLRNPLFVWETKADDGEIHYYLLDGFRRFAAISKIREGDPEAFAKIPVTTWRGTLQDARTEMLGANVHQAQWTQVEIADYIKALAALGYTQQNIAAKVAKTQAWVSGMLSFATKATEEVREAVASGEVPMSAAKEIMKAPESEQPRLLEVAKEAAEKGGRGSTNAVRKEKGEVSNSRPTFNEIKAVLKWIPPASDDQLIDAAVSGFEAAIHWVIGDADFATLKNAFDYAGIPMPEITEPPKKRGRPAKDTTDAPPKKRGRKPKAENAAAEGDAAPKKRGRPPKAKTENTAPVVGDAAPKRRGRPPKAKVEVPPAAPVDDEPIPFGEEPAPEPEPDDSGFDAIDDGEEEMIEQGDDSAPAPTDDEIPF